MVERSAKRILQWSWWRRWHQAWAGYYHHRRQERNLSEQSQAQRVAEASGEPPLVEPSSAEPQHDEIEVVWKRLEPLLPPAKRAGHPYDYPRRLMLEAIVYVMRTNCGWSNLPSQFPPWKTVYSQYRQWRKTGIWGTIWADRE